MKKNLLDKKYIIVVLWLTLVTFLWWSRYSKNPYIEECPKNKIASRWDLFEDWTKKITECSKPLTCYEWHFIETQCSVRKYRNKQEEEYYECFTFCRKEWWPPIF